LPHDHPRHYFARHGEAARRGFTVSRPDAVSNIMGACVSSPPATSPDAPEGSRAPTNTPEAKSGVLPKTSDGLSARTPSTVDRTPPAGSPHAGTLPAPPRVDRRSTPGTALADRVRQRAESLEREEQFQFSTLETGDTPAEGRRGARRAGTPTPSPTPSPLDRLYSCGLASPDPLSPHPLSPDPPSESEGEGPREEDEEARNDEKENDDDATPLRKGRTLVRASTPEGERVVVSPALKRVA
jgi:hypothetical protein